MRWRMAASKVAKAWSGSSIGYHANIYYEGLKPPPPGAMFDSEWGLKGAISTGTRGDWRIYDPDEVESVILRLAGEVELDSLRDDVRGVKDAFHDAKEAALSCFMTYAKVEKDSFMEKLRKEVEDTLSPTAQQYFDTMRPRQIVSRDSTAVYQGVQAAPHIKATGQALEMKCPISAMNSIKKLCLRAISHIDKFAAMTTDIKKSGSKIFIGHGRSLLWRDLKDFLQDRLRLGWDEFNRVPVAGTTTISRLESMLGEASFAFLVMTAEDELPSAEMHPRLNVVHEAGLFQGRLGFNRAIILLEAGCAEFSNIIGLSQIRFPKGNIKACFEDVRQVLEREGLLA